MVDFGCCPGVTKVRAVLLPCGRLNTFAVKIWLLPEYCAMPAAWRPSASLGQIAFDLGSLTFGCCLGVKPTSWLLIRFRFALNKKNAPKGGFFI